jgi:hypothetical protein
MTYALSTILKRKTRGWANEPDSPTKKQKSNYADPSMSKTAHVKFIDNSINWGEAVELTVASKTALLISSLQSQATVSVPPTMNGMPLSGNNSHETDKRVESSDRKTSALQFEEESSFSDKRTLARSSFRESSQEISARRKKVQKFLELCQMHEEFLTKSVCVDDIMIAITFIYFQRAKLSLEEYNDNNLLAALCLAWQTEEDCRVGEDDILAYSIGSRPVCTNPKDDVAISQWKRQLHAYKCKLEQFMKEKNQLWRRLGYRTCVSYSESLEVIDLFKQHEELFPISKCGRELKHLLQIYQIEKDEYVSDNDEYEKFDEEMDSERMMTQQLKYIQTTKSQSVQQQSHKHCQKKISASSLVSVNFTDRRALVV